MIFSVIYSFECPPNERVRDYYPSNHLNPKVWSLTEWHPSEHDDDDYLLPSLRWKHRKIVGLLTKQEFIEFVDECSLVADDVETMGSLGAPGFGIGWSPAISFNTMDYLSGYGNAYVTPIPFANIVGNEVKETLDHFPLTDKHWDRIKAVIVRAFS